MINLNSSIRLLSDRPDSTGTLYSFEENGTGTPQGGDFEQVIRARLNDIFLPQFAFLQDSVSALENRIKNIEFTRIRDAAISNLGSKKIFLKQPLYVTVELDGQENIYFVNSLDLNLWGYGETEQLALKNFCDDVAEFYSELKKNKRVLGTDLKRKFEFLKLIIIERRK